MLALIENFTSDHPAQLTSDNRLLDFSMDLEFSDFETRREESHHTS